MGHCWLSRCTLAHSTERGRPGRCLGIAHDVCNASVLHLILLLMLFMLFVESVGRYGSSCRGALISHGCKHVMVAHHVDCATAAADFQLCRSI